MPRTQTRDEVLATFTETERTAAAELSNYIADNFVYTPWTAKEKEDLFRKESLEGIHQHGIRINFLVPCVATAAVISEKLNAEGKKGYLVAFTEKGALDRYRSGTKGRLHLDVAVKFEPDNRPIYIDVGASDIQIGYEVDNARPNDGNKLRLRLSRTNEGEMFWDRTILAAIPIDKLVANKSKPVLRAAIEYWTGRDVPLPFGLKEEDVFKVNDIVERDRFNMGPDNLEDYKGAKAYNEEWVQGEGRVIFPGIKPFDYSFKTSD